VMLMKKPRVIVMHLVLASILVAVANDAAALLAGQPYYDYYDRNSKHIVESVNFHHLLPAEDTLRSKRANRLESAAGDLRFVLDYVPNHPQALFMMVGVALEWKKPQLIEKFLDEAIETFPNTPSTWTIQGIYLARVGRFDAAIASYQRALALKPDDMQTHYNLGLAYVEKKKWTLANQHAQAAYRLGAPLTGLKEKLVRAGAWNSAQTAPTEAKEPLPDQTAGPQASSPPRPP